MKILIGKVVSSFMNKTVIVHTNVLKKHIMYNKYIKSIRKYYVHDEYNLGKIGDLVLIKHVKPISKTKFWIIIKFL